MSPIYKTYCCVQEGSSKSLHIDLNKDTSQVVVASSAIFKIYDIADDDFIERVNLRSSKVANLNFSSNCVAWNKGNPHILATGATNGAVVIWNMGNGGRTKIDNVYSEHKRTVNKVCFHPFECNYLISGSQDGNMKLFDLRMSDSVAIFLSNSTSVRDVEFNAHANGHLFGAVLENGAIQLWDVRRPDRPEKKWPVHSDHVFALNWHPESRFTVATAGRDKQVKVWDSSKAKLDYMVHTIGPVGSIAWRPGHKFQIASCSGLVGDFSVNVWDVRRPFIPYAVFSEHNNVATGVAWLKDADRVITCGKDNMLCHHAFNDATRPGDSSNPNGLSVSIHGHISHAYRDGKSETSWQNSSLVPFSNYRSVSDSQFKSSKIANLTREEVFLLNSSHLEEFRPKQKSVKDQNFSWTDSTFAYCARHLVITADKSVVDACDHNARICESVGRHQHADTWRMMGIMADNADKIFDLVADITLGDADTSDADLADNEGVRVDDDVPVDNGVDGQPEVKVRSRSGTNEAVKSTKNRNKVSSGGSQKSNKFVDDMMSDDDGDIVDDEDNNELTLTNIASGQLLTGGMCSDFFGDSYFAGSITLERFVSVDPGSAATNDDIGPGWELKSEAFEPRVDLNLLDDDDTTTALNELGDDFVVDEVNMAPSSSGGAPNPEEMSVTTVTVEDKTSALLATPAALDRAQWMPNLVVKNAMEFYAELGDVQMAVTIYLTLGRDRIGNAIDEATLEFWLMSYIDLLHRLRLYNVAANVIKTCHLDSVRGLSQQSTTFLSNCSKCSKALSRQQGCFWCSRCKRTPNLCCVCSRVIRGLFVWCQGCCHGGHYSCLERWYANDTLCPTGCGHHCEYQ